MRVEDRQSGECVADCLLCCLLSRSGELRTGTGFHVRLAAAGTSERGRRCRRLHRPASIALRRRSEPAAGSSDAINFVYIADMSKNGRWPSPTIVTQLQKNGRLSNYRWKCYPPNLFVFLMTKKKFVTNRLKATNNTLIAGVESSDVFFVEWQKLSRY